MQGRGCAAEVKQAPHRRGFLLLKAGLFAVVSVVVT